ncbi:dihydrolipoamide acetyltransferase family protein [Oceanibaculum sp.]|nr:dihydrolipoamide acetyltransferase family protein [Oceanibaculum sp.]MCH2395743.1 2-oxo acid dehydrogenase subunit E2 [Oceanibaculum sp.]
MPSSPANKGQALTDLVMPKLGLTMTEGVLAEWKVKPGDSVSAGAVIFVVETDKIANEVEAPSAGTIAEILVQTGETVPVGTAVARWTGKGFIAEAPDAPEPAMEAPKPVPVPASAGERVRATPLARRIAKAQGVDLHAIAGSGPDGRIKAADVTAAAKAVPSSPPSAEGERIALSAKYLSMVRRVVTARREIPDFQIVRTADVGALLELRAQLNAAGGRKISVNDMVLKAAGRALLTVPRANRIWDHDAHIAFTTTDVGMVVNSEEGLFIPILRDVGRLPLDRLAGDSADAAAKAREGRLGAADMTGGAISVSNLGMFGAKALTPIISPPQSAILGIGAVEQLFRPDSQGKPALRQEMTLTLSCDHRVYDGVLAARLLQAIAEALEAPHSLLRTED